MKDLILTSDRRIRVFLSSRLPEFKSERAALVKVIEGMELTALYFEETARPHPAAKVYRKFVAETDIFVGIYGTGYGWVDTDAGMSISGVEDEWQLSKRKSRLVFVLDTNQPRESKLEALLKDIQQTDDVTYCKFRDSDDLVKKVKTALRLHIAERFLADDNAVSEAQPDAAEDVAAVLASHPVLVTEFLSTRLEPALGSTPAVFVSGGPGIGKTTALFQLSRRQPRTLYLSLRNQSALSAFFNLNRRLAHLAGRSVAEANSADDAQRVCEGLLNQEPSLLLIDDVDQALDLARIFARLKLGRSRLVLAGRHMPADFRGRFSDIPCPGFSLTEAREYLVSAGKSSPFEQAAAVDRANGNPLYLRYYLEAPAGELASSLEGYHAAMWTRLSGTQREIVGLCALSEVSPTLPELANALSRYRHSAVSPIALQPELESLGNILSMRKTTVRVFHPAFREYVAKVLRQDGLAADVHGLLAETFAARANGYLRIIHLARAGRAAEVANDLMRVSFWADITGRTSVSRLLLAAAIRVGRSKRDRKLAGVAMLQAAHVQHATRNVSSGVFAANHAAEYLRGAEEKDLAASALVTKATFLAEVGRGVEAERILLEVIEQFRATGDTGGEAATRINLAYVYIRRGLMIPLAEQCETAARLFKADGNKWGEAVATLNLQTYYIAAELGEKQIWCIRRLLTLAKELQSPRLRLAAYNGMISFYRRRKKYDRAEAIGLKTIALARRQGLWEVETINLANLGNVYRDAENLFRARECYEGSLALAQQRDSAQHVAFAQEQLANVVAREGDLPGAMALAEEALKTLRRLGNSYREANVEDDLAAWYGELGKDFEAAKSFERAGVAWSRAGLDVEAAKSFSAAIKGYVRTRAYGESVRSFEAAWKLFRGKPEPNPALILLGSLVPIEQSFVILLDVREIALQAADLCAKESRHVHLIGAVAALAGVCKHLRAEIGEPIYQAFLENLAGTGTLEAPRAVALAFAIEQAPGGVVASESFTRVCKNAASSAADLRYLNDGSREHWTIILPATGAPVIFLEVLSEAPGVRAAVASIALWFWARRQSVVRAMGRRRWRSLGAGYMVLGAGEAIRRGVPMPERISDKDTPSAVSRRSSHATLEPPSLPAFVQEDFLSYADRLREPNNRCSAFFAGELFVEVLREFSHGRVTESIAKEVRREFLCDLFAFRLQEAETPTQEFPEDRDENQTD